jgi:xanthine dehydrogenase YagT iron-sulfur-binding subunit
MRGTGHDQHATIPEVSATSKVSATMRVNGRPERLQVDARVTLLDALRDRLGLTGTKKGCDQGACGACTVLVDGKRVLSCLTLAAQCDNREVVTIEGLASNGTRHPVQEAFIHHDAFQCGYCTPGQIMSAIGLLGEGRAGSDADIREFMSGNICRCGAYSNIVAAIREVAGRSGMGGEAARAGKPRGPVGEGG